MLDEALRLAALGLPVFPIGSGSKIPAVEDFPHVATTDPEKIHRFFTDPILELPRSCNVGILMRGFVGVDIDVKEGRKGDDSVLELEIQGFLFPPTFTQRTPTGSTHLVYSLLPPSAGRIRNSVQRLAPGVDIRGDGGYLVGAGSVVPEGSYNANWAPVAPAPGWLLDRISRLATRTESATPATPRAETPVNREYAFKRGWEIATTAEPSQKGTRDSRAYALACELKNLGVDEIAAFEILDEAWAPRCQPPFSSAELQTPVKNAYQYAKDAEPILAPEYEFDELPVEPKKLNPIEELNRCFAFVLSGGGHHILFETTDEENWPRVDHLSELSFHRKLAAQTMLIGGKPQPISRLWMNSINRRSYDGFCFLPGKDAGPRYYNLFRGFTVEPAKQMQSNEAVAMFLEHCLQNVCQGDVELNEWLIGYFAHLFQRPWELPGTALVFRGRKGVGKNAPIERIGHLLGSHFMVAADQRYLSGNFNAHLESLLMLVLDEAFWSGQKDIEGILKHLVTGTKHNIERKGQESYSIKSRLRTVIIGNESWLVPATEDERRYAVFDIGEGRMQDEEFFEAMRLGLEAGGYSILLRYLLDFDLSRVKVRKAPNTKGLFEQKMLSAHPIERWWYDSLCEGTVQCATFIDGWPTEISRTELRDAYRAYRVQKRISGWGETDNEVGRLFSRFLPPLKIERRSVGGSRQRMYEMPTIEASRDHFSKRMQHKIEWEE